MHVQSIIKSVLPLYDLNTRVIDLINNNSQLFLRFFNKRPVLNKRPGGKIYLKLINVLCLIRASWREFSPTINSRPGTFIRHTRVQKGKFHSLLNLILIYFSSKVLILTLLRYFCICNDFFGNFTDVNTSVRGCASVFGQEFRASVVCL